MIIAATTEDIEREPAHAFAAASPWSSICPPWRTAPPEEKLALISLFFQVEASRIRKDILVEVPPSASSWAPSTPETSASCTAFRSPVPGPI